MEVTEMNLLNNVKVVRALNAQTTATAATTGRAIDTKGFEGVLFIAVGSSLLCGATAQLKCKTAASTTATFGTAAGKLTSASLASGSFNYKTLCLDVYRPLNRYVKPCVVGATSGTVRSITAILYGPRRPGSSACESTQAVRKTIVAATS
jgi:hypothetical protein